MVCMWSCEAQDMTNSCRVASDSGLRCISLAEVVIQDWRKMVGVQVSNLGNFSKHVDPGKVYKYLRQSQLHMRYSPGDAQKTNL